MAKLNNYKGSIELGSGTRPMGENDFALMDAHYIQVDEDGTRLDDKLASLSSGSSGAVGEVIAASNVSVTEEQYSGASNVGQALADAYARITALEKALEELLINCGTSDV